MDECDTLGSADETGGLYMTVHAIMKLLAAGEGYTVEYKACVNRISGSTYEGVTTGVTTGVTAGVTTGVTTDPGNITDKENEVLKLLTENPSCSMPQMAGRLSVSRKAIAERIQTLKKKKIIVRVGNNMSGYWKTVDQK
jgi:predicted HTH transcriptional regulator